MSKKKNLKIIFERILPRKKHFSSAERMIHSYSNRVHLWHALPRANKTGRRVAVVVTPWMETAVPLFSTECALAMARDGLDVTIFWDASPVFPNDSTPRERKALKQMLGQLKPIVSLKDISKARPANTRDRSALCTRILRNNAIARARGEAAAQEFLERFPGVFERALQHLGKVEAVLAAVSPDWLFVPGGVYATSAMYAALADEIGISVGTFDSDEGMLFVSTTGVATHHTDIPASERLFKAWLHANPPARPIFEAAVSAELSKRAAGRDSWGFQLVPARGAENFPCDVLVPLNLRWDTAALSRERLFPDVREWIKSIVRWAIRHPETFVCFRQHPCERHAYTRSSDDWKGWITSAAGNAKNVRFISAEETVNTYDLLKSSKVLVPYTSTLALEASLAGVPSILTTDCYYHGFGFSFAVDSEESFHKAIESAVAGEIVCSCEARENSTSLFFLSQLAAPVNTEFTPIPANFYKWVDLPPDDLWARPEMQDLRQCFTRSLPLSFLRAKRICHQILHA